MLKEKIQEFEEKLKTKSEMLRKTQTELEDKVHVYFLLESLIPFMIYFIRICSSVVFRKEI